MDGYAVINDVETVWEYNGCDYHGCECIEDPNEKQLQARQKWIERKAKLVVNGCKVIEMSCCKWRKQLRYLRRNPPKTELGRILCFDNQEYFYILLCFKENGQLYICPNCIIYVV